MTIPISSAGPEDLAKEVLSRIRSAYSATQAAQTENNANEYNSIVNIPSVNKSLQDAITDITGSGVVSQVVDEVNARLPSDVTVSDLQDFASAFNLLAGDVETNAAVFVLSINATTKRAEFVTPVSAGIKTAITNRINAVLTETV